MEKGSEEKEGYKRKENSMEKLTKKVEDDRPKRTSAMARKRERKIRQRRVRISEELDKEQE